jgi:hypothetical protein
MLQNLLLYLTFSEESLVDFINAFSNSLLTLFSISDTFGDDLLKSVIALFVVIDPIVIFLFSLLLLKKWEKVRRRQFQRQL